MALSMSRTAKSHVGHYSMCRQKSEILRKGRFYVPHAPSQATMITAIDDLQSNIWDFTHNTLAEYLETCPDDYLHCGRRLLGRLNQALSHGDKIVALGLLSKAQADYFASMWYGSAPIEKRFMGEESVREMLDISQAQMERVEQVRQEFSARLGKLKRNSEDYNSVKRIYQSEKRDVLDAGQIDTWKQICAKRPAPKPPDWTLLGMTDRKPHDLSKCSEVFRLIDEGLDLSDEQQSMHDECKTMTLQCLDWITEYRTEGLFPTGDHRNDVDNPTKQVRERFLLHAEGLVTCGVLTEAQADIIRETCAKNVHRTK